MCFLRTMIVTITMVRTVNNMAAVTLPAIAMVSVFFSPKFSEVLRAGIDGIKSGSLCSPGQHILQHILKRGFSPYKYLLPRTINVTINYHYTIS